MQRLVLTLLIVCLSSGALAQVEENTCAVRYLSAEHVYLDEGTTAGLAIGTQVDLLRDGKVFAQLEVVYAAGHSASCVVLHQEKEIKPGDTGVYETPKEAPVSPAVVSTDSIPAPRTRATFVPSQKTTRVDSGLKMRGSLALQWDHTNDSSDRQLQTDLLSMPFRIRIGRPDQSWTFRARGSLRHIGRNGFSASTETSEWRNRIREAALLRDNHKLAWNYSLGRISTRATASAGPFDGLSVSRSLSSSLRLGGFFGFSPRWEDYGFSTDDRVSGLSLQYERYSTKGNRLDVLLSGVGRYHQGEVSREYMVLTTTWSNPTGLSLLQSSELDFNRHWRKEAPGVSTVELSSLALTGRYKINPRFSINLGYDDRQPIRTWETRSLPDSLFSNAGRLGWRGGLSVRLNQGRSLNLGASLRSDERLGADTKSWNGRLYWPNFLATGLNTDASIRGFNGPWLSGYSPILGLGKSTRSGLRLRLEAGHYAYTGHLDSESRSNNWLKFLISKDLHQRWSVAADFRQDWGDDIQGQRWFLELRHRF